MNEIQLSVDPPSALITLNRPEVRNALSPKMVEHFHYFLDQLEKCQDVAAVIVTGEGKAFCGGADLGVLQQALERPGGCFGDQGGFLMDFWIHLEIHLEFILGPWSIQFPIIF